MTAAERIARDAEARREQWKREAQESRDRVIAEFGGDPQAMAAAIIEFRRAGWVLAEAANWMRRGGPFSIVPPGPYWPGHKQREAEEGKACPQPNPLRFSRQGLARI